jgi:putative endonuclease
MAIKEWHFYVYILASLSGTIYVGVTNNIRRRILEHVSGEGSEFTRKYAVNRLVYCEHFQYADAAIAREKEIKGWRRLRKVALIEGSNPTWRDLSKDFGRQFQPDLHCQR